MESEKGVSRLKTLGHLNSINTYSSKIENEISDFDKIEAEI